MAAASGRGVSGIPCLRQFGVGKITHTSKCVPDRPGAAHGCRMAGTPCVRTHHKRDHADLKFDRRLPNHLGISAAPGHCRTLTGEEIPGKSARLPISSIGEVRSLTARHLSLRHGGQCHCCPSRRGRRDPLVVVVRESALKVRLEFGRAAAHVPGSVFELRVQQEIRSALVDSVSHPDPPALA